MTDKAQPGDPCIVVIFGASGDLCKRKLIPALYNLMDQGLLPENYAVVGVSNKPMSHDEFRTYMTDNLKEFAGSKIPPERIPEFIKGLYYIGGNFTEKETFEKLAALLKQVDSERKTGGNCLFYLSVPPAFFGTIAQMLGSVGLQSAGSSGSWRRIVIEKPFGRDIDSSRELNTAIGSVFKENQVYRIDHYMGKETVQNIMMFRFANSILEPIWNRDNIDHVQITVTETLGVEGRGGYYDTAGAMRDIIQNHVFQVLAVIAMEPPISLRPDDIRNEKVKVIDAIQPMSEEEILENTVRGQYGPGNVVGKSVPGYREDSSVNPKSQIETFCAIKYSIEKWRWAGVPFYLRTGKRMPKRLTQAVMQFKRAPTMLFRNANIESIQPNRLIMNIQPQEGISLMFEGKIPGPSIKLKTVRMDFNYETYFHAAPETGYETLIYDVMIGDGTLFPRFDMVDSSWRVCSPILDIWQNIPARKFPNYAAGTWGPEESDKLMAKAGRVWWNPRD